MKTMTDYAIYCTEAQTKKAIELGAPIEISPYFPQVKYEVFKAFVLGENMYHYPTAEQMISWLEEKYLCITIRYTNDVARHWQADIDHACYIDPKCGWNLVDFNFASRKEATLAAIDAALEYLTNNKK